ncbi:MAG: sugar ABC transporter substrate-binding protein [Rectinemataceae bacterium]
MKRAYAYLATLVMLFGLLPLASGQSASQGTKGSGYTAIPFLEKYKDFKYKGDINVLYLVCTTAAEYFPDSYAVWKPIMEKRGIHIDLMGPPTMTDSDLISTLESELASRKYDIVVLYPITPAAITPLLGDIWDTYHVPILSYAFSPDTKSGHYYLGTSYYNAGTVLGKSIAEYVNKNAAYFKTLKTIPVVVYKMAQAVDQHARITGALDVLKKDGRFTLIGEYEANMEAPCLTQTETVLTDHPETEVIIGQIDNDVTGAYQAVTSGTYKHSSHLSLWGFDATGAVMALMYRDSPSGCVQGSSFIDHYQSGEALCELIPILVGAAKQDKLIQFDKADYDWLGTALSNYYLTVTPENVKKYYTPKSK